MATKIITVEATPPSESTGADYNKGAPLNAAEFDQNIVNLRAAVDRKASLNNPTFTGTVTLPSTTSIGDVSATELQYLNSVTSNVQDQINAKAPINNPTFTGTASLSAGTANGVLYLNGSKQVTSGSGLVFDSSGNLGIGTASPAAKLHVYASGDYTDESAPFTIGSSATGDMRIYAGVNNTSDYTYIGSVRSSQAYGNLVLQPNGGNLGIGTTSPGAKLHVNGSAVFNGTTKISSSAVEIQGDMVLGNFSEYSTSNYRDITYWASTEYYGNQPTAFIRFKTTGNVSSAITFATRSSAADFAERMRLDSSGNLLVGTTSTNPAGNNTAGLAIQSGGLLSISRDGNPTAFFNRSSSDGEVVRWYRQGAQVGSVSVTTSTTAYNTSSDYRLKENIAPMTGALSVVKQLKPCTYTWKADGSDGQGFIAHELAEVVPDCVTGEKDAVDADGNPQYQGIDTSFLVATLTAAIQEQQAIIESLTQRIEALEYTKQGE